MQIDEAFRIASADTANRFGEFFGAVNQQPLGIGMIIANAEYSTFLPDEKRFGVLRSLALLLTHECDIDPDNDRCLNEMAIVCPIIPLENLLEELSALQDDDFIRGFLSNITARNVNRLMYLPPINDHLPYGGYIYLNNMASTHLSKIAEEPARSVCMMGTTGFQNLDWAIEAHFRRPKANRIPFQPIS